MAQQYPHSIIITTQNEPEQGADGNYTAPADSTEFASVCRIEPASSHEPTVSVSDGRALNYRYVVYMPPTAEQFSFGDQVEITLVNGTEITGLLLQQYNGQMNTRIWV